MKTENQLVFSHPTGNANVKAALVGLLEAGVLKEFHTTVASYPGNLWDTLGRSRWGGDFQRRKYDERLEPITVQHPLRELGRMVAGRLGLRGLARHETGMFCIDAVYRAQDRLVAKRLQRGNGAFNAVYAYEDGALETFRMAQELGLRRVYDLPIAYCATAQRLLHEEAERLPQWEGTLGGTRDSAEKLARKAEEVDLAETVMCPSKFVADSLPQSARKKRVMVTPFGSPSSAAVKDGGRGKKLRVLFAGSMSQRKGLGDLLAAVRMLNRNDVELVVMGAPQVPMEFYRKEFEGFTYEPGRPHAQVLELMRRCDVFCLPSILEGRALVMQEAMSQGLPLIITPNTGGEDLIDEGITGFLVPIRRPDRIAEKIGWFADHRPLLAEMSRAAQTKAAQLTWNRYGQTVANAVCDLNS